MDFKVDMKFRAKTPAANDVLHEAAHKALVAVTSDVMRDAIELSPVRTGNNRRSITMRVADAKQFKYGLRLDSEVYSTSGYGGYLETGTYKMAARPYLRPAMDKNFTPERIAAYIKEFSR